MGYEAYLSAIKDELQRTGKSRKSLKVKTIMQHFGYLRRSQVFVDQFNAALDQVGLNCIPDFDTYIPLDERIYFSIKGATINSTAERVSTESIKKNLDEPIQVKHDFFYYLFDFGSEQEYEQFQACLDSNQPVGIFLVPLEQDFFSDVVVKVLSFELIRKYQYRGTQGTPISSSFDIGGNVTEPSDSSLLHYTSIFRFEQLTMEKVLLGTTGLELLDSAKFDAQFEQLSLYANKYNSEQFFILFHCPSDLKLQGQQRGDLFGHLVNRVSSRIPFVFTLKCKYKSSAEVLEKNAIYSHFRLLFEMPKYELEEEEISILDYFLELQKTQIQAESQLLLKIKPEHFCNLIWADESDEHIYLKYFAINTLENLGYDLSQIWCEVQLSSTKKTFNTKKDSQDTCGEKDIRRRPDIYIENKVIVEVETLRSKGFDGNNVFFDLVNRLLVKSVGWPEKLESLWLVLPGFEIARNYYQLKKTREILIYELAQKYGRSFQVLMMAPDYENHQLVPVAFDLIEYPSSKYPYPFPGKCREVDSKIAYKLTSLDFNDVQGLEEEKKKLKDLLRLQQKGYGARVNGIIFFGLPGCGKTLLAHALANESGRYFFQFSPADIQSIWIGQSQQNVRNIFSQAKKKAPSVLFIDELDSIGFSRNELHAHTDQKATINQLLIELNQVRDSDVMVIAATNRLSQIDSALKRSGRFDWRIPIFPPNASERAALFQHYLSQNLSHIQTNLELVNFDMLAKQSARFTSSDIELVCREVGNSVLLEELDAALTTGDIITFITNLQDGGLTLNQEQVAAFLEECRQLSVKSPKLAQLQIEWDLEA